MFLPCIKRAFHFKGSFYVAAPFFARQLPLCFCMAYTLQPVIPLPMRFCPRAKNELCLIESPFFLLFRSQRYRDNDAYMFQARHPGKLPQKRLTCCGLPFRAVIFQIMQHVPYSSPIIYQAVASVQEAYGLAVIQLSRMPDTIPACRTPLPLPRHRLAAAGTMGRI